MPKASLALDIDGTITTADKKQLTRLRKVAKKEKVPIYINTARDKA